MFVGHMHFIYSNKNDSLNKYVVRNELLGHGKTQEWREMYFLKQSNQEELERYPPVHLHCIGRGNLTVT